MHFLKEIIYSSTIRSHNQPHESKIWW